MARCRTLLYSLGEPSWPSGDPESLTDQLAQTDVADVGLTGGQWTQLPTQDECRTPDRIFDCRDSNCMRVDSWKIIQRPACTGAVVTSRIALHRSIRIDIKATLAGRRKGLKDRIRWGSVRHTKTPVTSQQITSDSIVNIAEVGARSRLDDDRRCCVSHHGLGRWVCSTKR